MKITYVEHNDGTKLFSFYRHDYKDYEGKDGSFIMIDGGFDYMRYSVTPGESTIKTVDIMEVIKPIRNQFRWTQRYDKDMNLLKKPKNKLLRNLTSDHIAGIILYLYDRLDHNKEERLGWIGIMEAELEYRRINNR